MIIGISGKRGTGKTSLADYWYRYGFEKISLADPLKRYCNEFWGPSFHKHGKEKPFFPLNDATPRDFMIDFGQFMRNYKEDFWLRQAKTKIEMIGTFAEAKHIVIDDVRFPNEADMIRSLGGVILRLERDPKLNIYGPPLDDFSETALDSYKFDYTISEGDNRTLIDLTNAGDKFLKQYKII